MNTKAFTLIELLVVLTIIGIIMSISFVGLTSSRESARNSKRKADLQDIRSALELYKADCGEYPSSLPIGNPLTGDVTDCTDFQTVEYIHEVPTDPDPAKTYYYLRTTESAYTLCAALENEIGTSCTGGLCNSGPSTEIQCNYKTTNP